jgi:hypothetical protein
MIPDSPRPSTPRVLTLLLVLSALVPIVIGGLIVYGYSITERKAPRHALHGRVVETKLGDGWFLSGFPDMSLTMELPGKPKSTKMVGGEPPASRAVSWTAYECRLLGGSLNIEGLTYRDGWKWELDELEASIVEGLETPTRPGSHIRTSRVILGGHVAVQAVWDFQFNGAPWRQYSLCCFGAGWQVGITYVCLRSNRQSAATWSRMLRTIQIGVVDVPPSARG